MVKSNEKSKSKRERTGFREFVCKALDIQPDSIFEDTLIELRGRNKLTLRGGGRMLSYSPEEIRVAVRRGELSVLGKRLFCSSYSKGFLEIDGLITEICFKEKEK